MPQPSSSVSAISAWAAESGGGDAVSHTVVLGNGGSDYGCQKVIAGLVPLGPGGAQVMMGLHLLEELLGSRRSVTWPYHTPSSVPRRDVLSGMKLRKLWPSLVGIPGFSFLSTKGTQHRMTQDPVQAGKRKGHLHPAHLTNSKF